MPWRALCRDCLLEMGADAFCSGHAQDGADAVAWAGTLPDTWSTLVRLSWVATGRVRADEAFLTAAVQALADADDESAPALAALTRPTGPR